MITNIDGISVKVTSGPTGVKTYVDSVFIIANVDGVNEKLNPTSERIGDWCRWLVTRNNERVSEVWLPLVVEEGDLINTGGKLVRLIA